MQQEFTYIGCFFDPRALDAPLGRLVRRPLAREVPFPHVTFVYRPDQVDRALFGLPVSARAVGYANDGKNEGLRVELAAPDGRLAALAGDIPVPHITLSVAAGARSVDTGRLDFSPIAPFAVQGVFGGFCRRGFPVTSPLSEEEARARADALACRARRAREEGDEAAERRLLEEALPCFQALAAGEDEATEALADQLFRLGDLCRNGGDLAGAARQLALCVRLREQLAAAAPCPAALDALACARGALGLLPGADPDHLEQAARLWQALALQQPAEERYARLRDTCLRALERRWGER